MNRETLPHRPLDDRAMLIADLLDDNDRLARRVADLEENQVWLSAMLKVALHQLHEHHVDGVWAREHRRGVWHDDRGLTASERAEWAA